MQKPINQRIKKLYEFSHLRSKRAFSQMIGLTEASVSSLMENSEPRFETITKILLAMPNISMEWLILGTGEMNIGKKADNNECIDKLCEPEIQYGDKGYLNEIEYLRAENARLGNMVGRLEGKIELLQEQLGLPKKDETFKGKSA